MANLRPAHPTLPGCRPKTHVNFRITLPSTIQPSSVELLGSWDGFRTAMPMEQDRRVGRDVWKCIYTQNGGLEMGSEHYYYFILDRKTVIPDPQSDRSSLHIDPRNGKMISVLFVPIELPPTMEPTVKFSQQVERSVPTVPTTNATAAASSANSSVFADFDGEGGGGYMDMFEQPVQPVVGKKGSNSLRDRLRARRSTSAISGEKEQKAKRRREWGLHSVSSTLLRMGYKSGADYEEDEQRRRDEEAIADIAGYLRSNDATPIASRPAPVAPAARAAQSHIYSAASSIYSQDFPSPTKEETSLTVSPSPGMYNSFYSSEDDDGDDEATTPTDVSFPKYYNFDELKDEPMLPAVVPDHRSDVRPLECLRDQVGGEMAWRQQILGEHGYLGSVVV